MSNRFGSNGRIAFWSIVAAGALLSFGTVTAFAGDDNVSEDQIIHALTPAKKAPLTRGLWFEPQTIVDPAQTAAETKLITAVRGRTTRSLSASEREEIASMAK